MEYENIVEPVLEAQPFDTYWGVCASFRWLCSLTVVLLEQLLLYIINQFSIGYRQSCADVMQINVTTDVHYRHG